MTTAWQDITGDVRTQSLDSIEIERGRRDEADRSDPSKCLFDLNNRGGQYSPRNPMSALYGKIGRNTPLRVRLGDPDGALMLPGRTDSYAWQADAAGLDVTGDLDLRIDLEVDEWHPAGDILSLARKYVTTGNQRSWAWWVDNAGIVNFRWSPDGTLGAALNADSTVAVPDVPGRLALRVALDVNNGAGGWTVTFYTAPSIAGPWVQLGATVSAAGVTSIFASTSPLEVGRIGPNGIEVVALSGLLYGFEMRSGIGGSAVASEDWTDPASVPVGTWTLEGFAAELDFSVRFSGEVAAWPPRWDLSDSDVWVPIVASGILRRLGQGQKPLRSALFRDLSRRELVAGYWPLEDPATDETGTITFASGRIGGPAAEGANVQVAAYSDLPASDAIPTVEANAYIAANVPTYPTASVQRYFLLVVVPDGGVPDEEVRLVTWHMADSTLLKWEVLMMANGNMTIRAHTYVGTLAENQEIAFGLQGGAQVLLTLRLEQSGGDLDWELATFAPDGGAGAFGDTLISQTIGRVAQIEISPSGGGSLGGVAVGHLTVLYDIGADDIWDIMQSSLAAWSGESTGARLARLCEDEGVPLVLQGDVDDTEAVGVQEIDEFVDLLQVAADADLGFLGELRQGNALIYRTRYSLYNQAPALTLDYAAAEVFDPISPTDDDQHARNEVTVRRVRGAGLDRAPRGGAAFIDPPPDGIGLYDTEVDVSLGSDDQLPNQAGWRLHLGTVNELRVPTLTLLLHNPRMAAHLPAVARIAEGDLIRIDNIPAWLGPGPLDLIVQGWSEQIGAIGREIEFTCTPSNAWEVAVLEDAILGRFDTAGSELAAPIDADDTALSVAVTEGYLWTTDGGEVPFDIEIGGEVMTVTAVSGGASPQTFTVTRSVNGIVKAHGAGAVVSLAHPARLAL